MAIGLETLDGELAKDPRMIVILRNQEMYPGIELHWNRMYIPDHAKDTGVTRGIPVGIYPFAKIPSRLAG